MNAPAFAPGGKIDTSKTLKPVRIAVLTISDTRDEESDTSGNLLASRVTGAGHELAAKGIVKDDVEQIRGQNPLDSEGGVQDYFGQLVQFQSLDAMQSMTKAINLLAEVSSLSQSAGLLGRSITAEIPAQTAVGELPQPPQVVSGEVSRVTFDDTNGAVVELDSGLRVPVSKIVAVE